MNRILEASEAGCVCWVRVDNTGLEFGVLDTVSLSYTPTSTLIGIVAFAKSCSGAQGLQARARTAVTQSQLQRGRNRGRLPLSIWQSRGWQPAQGCWTCRRSACRSACTGHRDWGHPNSWGRMGAGPFSPAWTTQYHWACTPVNLDDTNNRA